MTTLYLTKNEKAGLWKAATTGLRQMQAEGYDAKSLKDASSAIDQLAQALHISNEPKEQKP